MDCVETVGLDEQELVSRKMNVLSKAFEAAGVVKTRSSMTLIFCQLS